MFNFDIKNIVKKINIPDSATPFTDVTFSYRAGSFYLDCKENFRQIVIRYSGRILLKPTFKFPEHIEASFNYNKGLIIILNRNFERILENDVLFEYIGNFTSVSVRVYGYNNNKTKAKGVGFSPAIEFSNDDTLLSDSDEIFERGAVYQKTIPSFESHPEYVKPKIAGYGGQTPYGTIEGEEVEFQEVSDNVAFKTKYIRDRVEARNNIKKQKKFSNLKTRLPRNYRPAESKNIYCGNCAFLKKNTYCKLWKSPIRRIFVCNHWESRK